MATWDTVRTAALSLSVVIVGRRAPGVAIASQDFCPTDILVLAMGLAQ